MQDRPRILVVDDRPENLQAYLAALDDGDYEVVTASSGAAALREVLAGDFAVILLDVVMPDIDGFEVAALVKQKRRSRHTPIVFLTADADHVAARRGYELGAIDFIGKPIEPGVLRSKVRALVDLYRDRRQAERLRAAGEVRLAEVRRAAETRLHSLADAVPHIVFTAGEDGAVESLNRQWPLRTGMPVEDGLGMGWLSAIHPEDAGRLLERWMSAAEPVVEAEVRLRVRDGDYRAQLVQIVRDHVAAEGGASWVGTFTDVEAQHAAEAALRDREQQLAEARRLEAVGRLAGGVAHDFNNLLTAVLGYATVALKKLDGDHPAREKVEAIRDTAERATSITNQLLAFSRRQVLRPELLDLDEVVEGMASTLRPLAGEAVDLEFALYKRGLGVRADRSQLEQVLLNLVLNARDALPAGGRVSISTAAVEHKDRRCALLEVRDDGVGMDADTQALMFEPFFTTKPPGRGTGLGLSTVHGIVSQSDGEVTVQSAPGEGTTIRVTLPLHEAGSDDVEARPPRARFRRHGSPTVLLVDDDLQIREIARELLAGDGFVVLEASDGAEALRVAEAAERVDLLVTDLLMPGMGGEELGRRFHERYPAIPIVYVSGAAEKPGHAALSGDWFLAKPFRAEQLSAIVAEALAQPPERDGRAAEDP